MLIKLCLVMEKMLWFWAPKGSTHFSKTCNSHFLGRTGLVPATSANRKKMSEDPLTEERGKLKLRPAKEYVKKKQIF